jgi:lysyl-tRNA synthetase class II
LIVSVILPIMFIIIQLRPRIMQPKRHIVWSKKEIDLSDPFQKRWYIQQVLMYGRAEDIASLDLNELKTILPQLILPPGIRALWENYFAA